MVYNEGSEGNAAVRLATGNLLPDDYPETAITSKIRSAYSKIQLSVKRKLDAPFTVDDVEHDHCAQLEITIAAMYCLKAYGPEFLDKIKELREEQDADLLILQQGTIAAEEVADVEEINEATDPKSWNLNPEVPVPNRMTVKHTSGGIECQHER
jgi:hypothetical protein